MRVVLDTVVFVRGLITPSNACGRTIFLHGSRYRLILSKPIIVEILEVLRRPEVSNKFSSTMIDFRRILDYFSHAEIIELNKIPKMSRDVKDDKFLATALAADADYLVSEDKDLLVLGRYKGVKIVTCHRFADILEERA